MRFGIITDIHAGPGREHNGVMRRDADSRKLVKNFVRIVNNDLDLAFVVQLGDMIESRDRNNDQTRYKEIKQELSALQTQVYHVLGNHEQTNFSHKDATNLHRKPLYYTFTAGDYLCIVLFAQLRRQDSHKAFIDEDQLKWLKERLKRSTKKVLIFSHYPLSEQNFDEHIYNLPKEDLLLENRKEVRTLLESSGKVQACFNGHTHWNNMDVHHDIPYITTMSLVDDARSEKADPPGAYAIVDITSEKLLVTIQGKKPEQFSFEYK